MKLPTQLEVIQSVRKPALPKTRVERPKRGGGYRRKEKHQKPFDIRWECAKIRIWKHMNQLFARGAKDSNMKTLKLRLTLDVEIDPQGLTADDCKQYITRMVNHGIANGLLTGDSPATVEHYNFKVVTIKPKRKVKPYYPLDHIKPTTVYDNYPEGKCPDCGLKIPKTVEDGDSCKHCEHVFVKPTPDDDIQLDK